MRITNAMPFCNKDRCVHYGENPECYRMIRLNPSDTGCDDYLCLETWILRKGKVRSVHEAKFHQLEGAVSSESQLQNLRRNGII